MNLETERLIIRPIRESDLDDFFEYRSDSQVCEFQGFLPYTREKAEEYIQAALADEFDKADDCMRPVVELKSEKKIIGDIYVKTEDSTAKQVELGTTFSAKYQNKGFAREAITKIITHLFEKKNFHRAIAVIDIENAAAINLVEKLNFRREAEFKQSFWDRGKNEWRDEFLYAMLEKDWETK